MSITDDPMEDFYRNEEEKFEYLKSRPQCSCCGKYIQEAVAVYYNDQWCCSECEENFWNDIRDDFLERVDEY